MQITWMRWRARMSCWVSPRSADAVQSSKHWKRREPSESRVRCTTWQAESSRWSADGDYPGWSGGGLVPLVCGDQFRPTCVRSSGPGSTGPAEEPSATNAGDRNRPEGSALEYGGHLILPSRNLFIDAQSASTSTRGA